MIPLPPPGQPFKSHGLVLPDNTMSVEAQAAHRRMQTDFPFFARHAPLKIEDKQANILSFSMTPSQRYIYNVCEEQRRLINMVRVLIVKPRQIGSSTLRVLQNLWKASRNPGRKCMTIAHIAPTTSALQDKVKVACKHANPALMPMLDVSNPTKMVFAGINSQLRFATAGSKWSGVGETFQDVLGSEVSKWDEPTAIINGLVNGVPLGNDTSVVMESTTNGVGDWFHTTVQLAMQGKNPYKVVFIPWFWQAEYQLPLDPDEKLEYDSDESVLRQAFKVSDAQLKWRRFKVQEAGSLKLFKQEYPSTLQEAFQFGGNPLLDADKVTLARNCVIEVQTHDPLVGGADFGGKKEGEVKKKPDRTALVWRQGRVILPDYKVWVNKGPTELAQIIAALIIEKNPAKIFFDHAYGFAVADVLFNLSTEFRRIVTLVHFGGHALDEKTYLNKRAEMGGTLQQWFADGPVSIPNTDEFCTDLMAVPDFVFTTGQQRRKLPFKDDIRAVSGFSPDLFDATCLTLAHPVKNTRLVTDISSMIRGGQLTGMFPVEETGGLSTMQRKRGMK